MEPFWTVLPQTNRAPIDQHETLESAIEKAKKLAIGNNARYFVLKAVGVAWSELPSIVYEETEDA